jgi:hypothetical protein
MSRPSKTALIGLVTVVVALAALLYVRIRFAVPIGKLESRPMLDTEPEWLPKEPAPIKFTAQSMSTAERREFLNADYRIVRKVADLPAGIRKLYTPKSKSRVAIADPGEKFQETDVITSPDLPWRRLIFAGIAQDRAFIHYEKGGRGHSDIIELFRLESPDIAVGLWSGYRGPAKNIEELKELVLEEDHDSCQCEVKWQSVDQLCGQVELSTPTKKIIVVNGKKETRLYATHVKNAEVMLYRATMDDKACCGTTAPMARTHSGRFGGFEFSGVQEGLYWLRVTKGSFAGAIPLRLTTDFDAKSCHAPSTIRSFIVDAQPPTVETMIQ